MGAPVAALPALTAGVPQAQQPSLHQRVALGLLCTGALYRHGGPGGLWRCRAFPETAVRDATVQACAARGWADVQTYAGLDGQERACATQTPAGRLLYARLGGRHAEARPAPPQAERILAELEEAAAEVERQDAALRFQELHLAGEIATRAARLEALSGTRRRLAARIADLTRIVAEQNARLAGGRLHG